MNDFPNLPEIQEVSKVQKLNQYEIISSILESNEDQKKVILNILLDDLNVRSIQSEADKLGKSYNGIKKFGKTIKIINKLFVYG